MGYNSNSLLINEPPMQFLPTLAIVLENSNKALFLQQMQYLLSISRNIYDGERWVYNTMSEWNMMFPMLSQRTLKRTIEDLKTCNIDGEIYHLIKTKKVNHGGLNCRTYYTIDKCEMERLSAIAMQKKIIKRREIVLSTIHMLNDYERYASQFPNELPEKLIELIKWAVKNNVLINEKWCVSDEGKAILEKVANAKCQNDTPEVPKCPVGEVPDAIIGREASNYNASAILSPRECQVVTSKCQPDISEVPSCHSPSAKLSLPTIISKTYTKNTNIDSSSSNARTRATPTEFDELIDFYDKNINPKNSITPFEQDMLIKYCHDTSAEWVFDAIKQALLNGKPHLAYIQGVLKNWQMYGYGIQPEKSTKKVISKNHRNKSFQKKSTLDIYDDAKEILENMGWGGM